MSKKVLIIDDEENIRHMMRLTLEAAGYAVGEAPDGRTALELYGDGSPWDAVILDQRMAGMDGLETLYRLKQRNAEKPVIMATAYASIELAVDAMKLGATDFVRKPLTPETLRNAVVKALTKLPPSDVAGVSSVSHLNFPLEQRNRVVSGVIPTLTLNGFTIVRVENASGSISTTSPVPANERRFIVISPEGQRHEVRVLVSMEPIKYVERITHRYLPENSSFWTFQCERLLSDYLWNEAQVPPGRRLTLETIRVEELPVAASWKD